MTNQPGKRSAYLFIAVVAILAGALVYQQFELRALRNQVEDSMASAAAASENATEALTLSSKQESRIETLERRTGQAHGTLPLPSPAGLEALEPGYYRLTTSSRYDPDLEVIEEYTITHVQLLLEFDDYSTRLNVGLARSGLSPQGVYFDYDNDGEIDVDMALDFVRDIPVVGRRLSRSYDADVAQNLYSIFVREAANAEYTSVEDLANDAEAASNYLWTFLRDHYDAMKVWVLERIEADAADEEEGQRI